MSTLWCSWCCTNHRWMDGWSRTAGKQTNYLQSIQYLSIQWTKLHTIPWELWFLVGITYRNTEYPHNWCNGPLTRNVKLRVRRRRGMRGTFSPPPRVSDPDMHHGTCVMHVPWCMPGSPTSGFLWSRRRGETFPAFPAHAQPGILRIW